MNDGRRAARGGGPSTAPRRGFSLSPDAFKMPLGLLGGLLILGAAGYYLIFAAFDTPMRIMLAAGILLIGIAVAIDPEAVWGRMTTRGALYGGNTLAIAAIFLGILALLNVLGVRRPERWDLTATKQFSISGESTAVLQQAPQPIQVIGFFQNGDPGRQDYESLLKEYGLRSNGKLTYELVDPIENPALAQQYAIRELNTSVLLMGDRRQQITGTREADLTTGLLKLVQVESRKAYFTAGHNERQIDGFEPQAYGQAKTQLEARNFVVEPLTLLAAGEVPDDASLVVIAGPRVPFAPEEVDALSRYLDRFGRIMLLVDPQTDTGMASLLAAWKIELGQQFIVEADPNLQFRSPFNAVVARFPQHKTTENLLPLLFYAPTYLNVAQSAPGGPAGPTVTAVAQSSQRSWAETDAGQVQNPQTLRLDEGQDVRGPLTLAAVAERQAEQAPGADPSQQPKKARMVVVGTSRLAANEVFQLGPQIGNVDFFVNAATWLAGDDELVSIPAKPQDNRTLVLTSAQQNFVLVSSVLFLPALVLAAGIAVWWSRR